MEKLRISTTSRHKRRYQVKRSRRTQLANNTCTYCNVTIHVHIAILKKNFEKQKTLCEN